MGGPPTPPEPEVTHTDRILRARKLVDADALLRSIRFDALTVGRLLGEAGGHEATLDRLQGALTALDAARKELIEIESQGLS